MKSLSINVHSDDSVGVNHNEETLFHFDTAELNFLVTLSDGTRLPGKVEYDGSWNFHLLLPEGANVGVVDPEDEESNTLFDKEWKRV